MGPAETEFPNLDEEVRKVREEQVRLSERVEQAIQVNKATEGRTAPTLNERLTRATEAGFRCFIAPAHKNCHFLVVAGKVQTVPTIEGPRQLSRDGDVWADFSGGFLLTDDPIVIDWCEKNHDICRDVMEPQTEAWAALREGQLNTSKREPSIPASMDIEAMLRGDVVNVGGADSLVAIARSVLSGKGA